MRLSIILFFFFLSSVSFSQINRDTTRYIISKRTLNSFMYHVPKHKSPKFKLTCRTAFNRDVFDQALEDGDLTEIFDDVEFSQFLKYNVRARWKFKNRNKIFIGAETMGYAGTGIPKNAYYIGFKKYF